MLEAHAGYGVRKRWSTAGTDYVRDLAWSPAAHRLAVAMADGTVTVCDELGAIQWSKPAHMLAATAVVWLSDEVLLSGGEDNQVRAWSAVGECFAERRFPAWIDGLRVEPGGMRAAVRAGPHLAVLEWRDAEGLVLRLDRREPNSISDVHWLRESGQFVTASYFRMRFWDVAVDEPIRELSWQGSMIAAAVSPDQRFAAAGTQEQSVHLWDLVSGEELYMAGFGSKVAWLGWTADGRWLATASGDGLIHWDCSDEGPKGKEPFNLPLHLAAVRTMALHPRRYLIASGDQEGMLLITGVPDGRTVAMVNGNAAITRIAWRGDSASLAAGDAAGGIAVWSLTSS